MGLGDLAESVKVAPFRGELIAMLFSPASNYSGANFND